MVAAAPNRLHQRFCQELARQLRDHRVVLVFDPGRQLRSFLDDVATQLPTDTEFGSLDLGDQQARWWVAGPSLFQLRHQLEPAVAVDLPDPLLVYIPDHQLSDTNRITLLELIRAGTVFDIQLLNRARPYLRQVMEPEKVEQLLARSGITYREIAQALEQAGFGSFSQLKGLFQQQLKRSSPPENAELARLWLATDTFDAAILAGEFCPELGDLLREHWGLELDPEESLGQWRHRVQQALLLYEFLHDWHGDTLDAFARQALPAGKAAQELALRDVKALRRDDPRAYREMAARIETDLGLPALLDAESPEGLGSIDTFPCEEQFLLRQVDMLLATADYDVAQNVVRARHDSFWLVGQPGDPAQLERRAQWELAETAAELGRALAQSEASLPRDNAPVEDWLTYQASVAHLADGYQRRLEEQVAELTAAGVEILTGLDQLRSRYDQLLEKQTRRFTEALTQAGWLIPTALPQTRIWADRVQPGAGRPVVFWVDALRYEMGVSLHERFSGWSSDQLSDLRLEIAQAALPTITPVGMAALLPGAERSFTVVAAEGSPCSVVDGVPVGWGSDKPKRLAHLRQRVPTVVVLSLVEVLRARDQDLIEKLSGSGPVVITSSGIDEAGERDTDERISNVRADMQRELETLEKAARRLTTLPLEQPLERFVITADHGFLHLPQGREAAMRIPPPEGRSYDLERRCWLGHPSAVPEPCIEISPSALAYGANGLSVVVPRSAGVFRAGGSLCYHHGGTSLQELLIPLISFRARPTTPVDTAPKGRGRGRKVAWPGELPDKVTNRVLMVPIELPVDLLTQGQTRQTVLAAYDCRNDELVATPIQAIGAELDRDTNRLSLTLGQAATIGLLLPAEVSATKLYLELRDAATNVVIHRSLDLPVDLIS